MADEYAAVKRGKLILKGEKPKAKKRKHKKEKSSNESKVDVDPIQHGGWWKIEKVEDVTGSVSIEFGNNSYVSALDNGLFTIGAPHGDGEGPSPEEIFTAFPAGDNKFALKSGYGKYVGVSKDGKTAILSSVNKFMSVSPEDDSLVARNLSAVDHEFCNIRSNKSKEISRIVVAEEEGDLNEQEVPEVSRQKAASKRG
ncbi:Protein FRG1 [Operophtera brumata]|uniref:Protein FRG1 n=1 Tax=Operophtera brumata TaxID=104452 RepID=A0A0L7LC90_OPEBR|nr:Protein FRG1 [Operophtera brumata]